MSDKTKKNEHESAPYFPFDKAPWQEKGESGDELEDNDQSNREELDIGESEKRTKKRSLDSERDAGYEP